jgi:hypothetical protein
MTRNAVLPLSRSTSRLSGTRRDAAGGANVLLHYIHDTKVKELFKELPWFRYADNLCYLCRGMSEGRRVLTKVNRLLEPFGLTLKGEDGVKDLRSEIAHLLGFSLMLNGKSLQYGIGPGAFTQLRQHLGEAHVTHHPTQTAQAVVLGWIGAFAPALEDGDVTDVLAIAAEYGFREFSLDSAREHWQGAWSRWSNCRERARRLLRIG